MNADTPTATIRRKLVQRIAWRDTVCQVCLVRTSFSEDGRVRDHLDGKVRCVGSGRVAREFRGTEGGPRSTGA